MAPSVNEVGQPPALTLDDDGARTPPDAPQSPRIDPPQIPSILPAYIMFPIKIGNEMFWLSGQSLSSDGPSYFTDHFADQIERAKELGREVRDCIQMVHVDRDPAIFRDIVLHLQGYRVVPRNNLHFVRLFADASYFRFQNLTWQLLKLAPIYITIGGREFQISKNIFSDPGNTPNYFTVGWTFFQPSRKLFPGLKLDNLVRPPQIEPPVLVYRSADTFADLLRLLQGYPVDLQSEEHREALLSDCRYYMFKGLEQKLIPHWRGFNQARGREEIVIRLPDMRRSGISIASDVVSISLETAHSVSALSPSATPTDSGRPEPTPSGWVNYARPFVDKTPAELVIETIQESARIHFDSGPPRVEFFGDTAARMTRFLQLLASKLHLPVTVQPLGLLMSSGGAESQPPTPGTTTLCDDDRITVVIASETSIVLDGKPFTWEGHLVESDDDAVTSPHDLEDHFSRKRRRTMTGSVHGNPIGNNEWIVKTAQWRPRIRESSTGRRPMECVLVAVKIDAFKSSRARNEARPFLGV